MKELPGGWVSSPLLAAIELHDSRRIPLNASERAKRQGPFPYYGANGLVDHVDSYIFEGDFVLLAEDGGNFDKPERGVAYEVSGRFWVNNHAHILKPRGDMPVRFLRYWLNAVDWMPYVGGTTRAKLTQAGMSQINIPLPPPAEQRRIVAKLDSLTGRTARAREELERIPRLIQKFRDAILAKAYEGGFLNLPETDRIPLSGYVANLDQGWSPKCEPNGSDDPREWAVIKTTAIQPIHFSASDNKKLPIGLEPRPSIQIEAGDVLVTRAGPRNRVGIACVVASVRPRLMLCDKAYRLRAKPGEADPTFIALMLNAPQALDQIEGMKSGISDSGLNLTQEKFLSLSLPRLSLQQQQATVDAVHAAFAWLDRVTAEHAHASRLLPKLDQAILAKAFRGELVPQDPDDKPIDLSAHSSALPVTSRRGRPSKQSAGVLR